MTEKTIYNPPFDKRIYTVHGTAPGMHGDKSGLTRGFLVQDQPNSAGVKFGFRFLYNPTAISVSHSVDTNIVNVHDPNDLSSLVAPLQQSVSFSLLLDRTYESWDAKYYGAPRATDGVYVDIAALYSMVGINSWGGTQQGTTDDGTNYVASDGNLGVRLAGGAVSPMVYTPMRAYLGGPLNYYGVITSLNVVYSHWTQKMVPNRAGVDISINLLPETPPSANPPTVTARNTQGYSLIQQQPAGLGDGSLYKLPSQGDGSGDLYRIGGWNTANTYLQRSGR